MYINGKIDVKKFKTVENVDSGECFVVVGGDGTIYMKTDSYGSVIEVSSGELHADFNFELPAIEIQTELKIIDAEKQSGSASKISDSNNATATEIVEKIDGFGRIHIPKEIRKIFKIHESDPFQVLFDKESKCIMFKKVEPKD